MAPDNQQNKIKGTYNNTTGELILNVSSDRYFSDTSFAINYTVGVILSPVSIIQ